MDGKQSPLAVDSSEFSFASGQDAVGGNGHAQTGQLMLEEPGYLLLRQGRFLWAALRLPHRVLSTCSVNGGLRDDLGYLLNHQSCEAKDHQQRYQTIKELGDTGYHRQVCVEMGLPADAVAMMGTAANMNYAAVRCLRDVADVPSWNRAPGDTSSTTERFALVVTAIVTAGVHGNAACAGDPATWRETPDGWVKVKPFHEQCNTVGSDSEQGASVDDDCGGGSAPVNQQGTINTMLLVNQPLTDGAMARAVVTMTEAKSAALSRLAIGSRYSTDAATGTGTDQFCIAAERNGLPPFASASQHVRLGEMIGLAVRDATMEALRWQNGLEPSYTRGIFHALGRFGVNEESLLRELGQRLDEPTILLLRQNSKSVFYEPLVGGAAYAMVAVLDRLRYQTLSKQVAGEALRQQGASMAVSLSGRPDQWTSFYDALHVRSADQVVGLVADAIALGWKAKWS